jgi:hypothetical protein
LEPEDFDVSTTETSEARLLRLKYVFLVTMAAPYVKSRAENNFDVQKAPRRDSFVEVPD